MFTVVFIGTNVCGRSSVSVSMCVCALYVCTYVTFMYTHFHVCTVCLCVYVYILYTSCQVSRSLVLYVYWLKQHHVGPKCYVIAVAASCWAKVLRTT